MNHIRVNSSCLTQGMLVALLGFFINGCATPRSHSLFGLQFADQAPRALMDVTCNGVRQAKKGVAVCEEKSPREASILVKILPTPGRVIFSDGLTKKIVDFNWSVKGGWWWKKTQLKDTWVPVEIGFLSEKFGDVPVALDITGVFGDVGVVNSRGVVYHRICNDRDIPCSNLIVDYECGATVKNTAPGEIGECVRMSGSPERFRIPLKTLGYELKAGAELRVRSGRSTWTYERTISADDVKAGELKFSYPTVLIGPDLFLIEIYQWEQGVAHRYRTNILLSGYDPKWTGIDAPHYIRNGSDIDWCAAIESELTEVLEEPERRKIIKGRGCEEFDGFKQKVCAHSWDRDSGDSSHMCYKNGKEVDILGGS